MSSPFQSPTESHPRRRRVLPLVLTGCAVAGVIAIAACGGLLYFGFRQVTGEGEIAVEVDRFFDYIQQQRAADFYRQYCSIEFKQVMNEQDFVSICQTIDERLGKLNSKELSGFKVSNQNLTTYVNAGYDCEFEHGKATAQMRFKREGGRWMLLAFNVNSPALLKDAAREKCPHCGQEYEVGAKFCPHCGKAITP